MQVYNIEVRRETLLAFEETLFRPIIWRVLAKTKDKSKRPLSIFARTACVGNAVLAKSFRLSRLNLTFAQKCHLDLLNMLDSGFKQKTSDFREMDILNADSKRWFAQICNESLLDTFLNAQVSIFDSFCELTDQKIKINSGIYSYGHFNDFVNPKLTQFQKIDLDVTFQKFTNLVKKKELLNPRHPIIYLHYSARNDLRSFYQERSIKILKLAELLQSNFSSFRVLKLDEEQYIFKETDNFPYHYGQKTIDLLAREMSLILSDYGISTDRYTART